MHYAEYRGEEGVSDAVLCRPTVQSVLAVEEEERGRKGEGLIR
jgi:hypothetical protein